MSETKHDLESISAEFGMSVQELRPVGQTLSSVDAKETQWKAWCEPLVAQAKRLNAFAREHTAQECHPLERPGLYISMRGNQDVPVHFDIQIHGAALLSVGCDPLAGIYLSGPLCTRSATDPSVGGNQVVERGWHQQSKLLQVGAHLERGWHQQSKLLQDNWPDIFSHALAVMERAEQAIVDETPLEEHVSWPIALIERLKGESEGDIDPKYWYYWVHRWGPPEMASGLDIVTSLFEPRLDVLAWRSHLLQSWENTDCGFQLNAEGQGAFEIEESFIASQG